MRQDLRITPSGATYAARVLGILGLVLLGACPRSITDPGYVLTVSPSAASLFVDDSARFTATLRDRNGVVIPTSFTWSTDNETVASIDSAGIARGVGPGSAAVQVTARGQVATADITVAAGNGQTLTVTPTTAEILVNAGLRFTATLRNRNGDPLPATPQWSSTNTSVATVDGSGLAQGKAGGSVTIEARVGDLVAEAALTVTPRAASGVLVGAGDIASCATTWDAATADLLDGIAGTVFTAGDNAYPNGTPSDYANCYGPTWGRHKARTRPTPGNHEYITLGAAGYFGYFGAAAGEPAKGYYSYDVGPWHIIALNSNFAMHAGSPQEQWLRADLAANSTLCTLAYWHHPRFSSGPHGSSAASQPLWQALYDARADVVIVGHDHTYERFAPQTPTGQLDMARGLRQFIVGTGGGEDLYAFVTTVPNSEVRNNTTRGVLKLTLNADRYEWRFVPIAGSSFTDTGSASCR